MQEFRPLLKRLMHHVPPNQLMRYVLVGAWNTLFGYGCYFLSVRVFLHVLPIRPALTASIAFVVAAIINVTVSFLGYKWFVFHTQGNYWREYGRSMLVYLPSLALSAIAIAPLTEVLRLIPSLTTKAPYIAGALVACVTTFASFFGHKHISFKVKTET